MFPPYTWNQLFLLGTCSFWWEILFRNHRGCLLLPSRSLFLDLSSVQSWGMHCCYCCKKCMMTSSSGLHRFYLKITHLLKSQIFFPIYQLCGHFWFLLEQCCKAGSGLCMLPCKACICVFIYLFIPQILVPNEINIRGSQYQTHIIITSGGGSLASAFWISIGDSNTNM